MHAFSRASIVAVITIDIAMQPQLLSVVQECAEEFGHLPHLLILPASVAFVAMAEVEGPDLEQGKAALVYCITQGGHLKDRLVAYVVAPSIAVSVLKHQEASN